MMIIIIFFTSKTVSFGFNNMGNERAKHLADLLQPNTFTCLATAWVHWH